MLPPSACGGDQCYGYWIGTPDLLFSCHPAYFTNLMERSPQGTSRQHPWEFMVRVPFAGLQNSSGLDFLLYFKRFLLPCVIHSNQLHSNSKNNYGDYIFRKVTTQNKLKMHPQETHLPFSCTCVFSLCKMLLEHIGYCQNIYTGQW